ncbi:MAG: translation elongation factor Ts [Anaerovoracaceae bacterium]
MAVTAQMVKELRERTGAGMMDCKKVLVETDGNMDKSIELLREKGLAKAAKKAGRVAAEGLVATAFSEDGKAAAIVEVNSETDFVAKNGEFKDFVKKLANKALEARVEDIEVFLSLPLEDGVTIQDSVNEKIAKIGENLQIRRFARFEAPGAVYAGYVHGNGKIGVIVQLDTDAEHHEVEHIGKDVSMQVASMNPKYVHEDHVDSDYVEQEKKILKQQVLNEGKKPEMADKIVEGKIKKALKEVVLLEQKFVKDGEKTVKQYVEDSAEKVGKKVIIGDMIRYEVGEGIEKKEENFAEEVAKQIKG